MLVNGKTDEEYLQILNTCLCANFINRNDKVLNNRIDNFIKIYCNKNGDVLDSDIIEQLKSFGELSKGIKSELNIDDNWNEEYYEVDIEPIMQLLFMANREQLLSIVKDMMCCLAN